MVETLHLLGDGPCSSALIQDYSVLRVSLDLIANWRWTDHESNRNILTSQIFLKGERITEVYDFKIRSYTKLPFVTLRCIFQCGKSYGAVVAAHKGFSQSWA